MVINIKEKYKNENYMKQKKNTQTESQQTNKTCNK